MADEHALVEDARSYLDSLLDAALADSFPASDPVAISLEFTQPPMASKPTPETQPVRE